MYKYFVLANLCLVSTLIAFNTEMSIKHDKNKNYPGTPSTRNGSVQKIKIVESNRRKLVKPPIKKGQSIRVVQAQNWFRSKRYKVWFAEYK